MTVLIVGGGLTGCTVAHELAQGGHKTVIVEGDEAVGGLVRSDVMHGVIYEPHGSHIFHTEDEEVWTLANSMTPFNNYRHRVDIMIEGRLLNWPILERDFDRQSKGDEIRAELATRRDLDSSKRAVAANFEDWCLDLMGPILYERYIKPYTMKQWGRPPSELSASWAPRRVSVRWDNDPYLFPDRFQGWPSGAHGYTDLITGLTDPEEIEIVTRRRVALRDVSALVTRYEAEAVVLTCPLDVFADEELGTLEWRGILVENVYIPHVDLAQGAMVVNYPGIEYPFIRVHETKHASGQVCRGTVLGFEFTGAATRYYPVEHERNVQLNRRYQELIRGIDLGAPVFFAGRLANYVYIDMDDCMRQAIDTARELRAKLYM
jgi:UDP-galactopyranose mutase